MKKIVLIIILAVCLCFVAGCTDGQNVNTNQPSQTSGEGIVVSVYDPEVNLAGQFSFQNPTGNSIDVTQFARAGYRLEGIFDMNQGIMLFNASGNQSPTVMLDRDFTAVLKYVPVTYQLVFNAQEGELENPAEYTKMISYGEAVSLFPKPVLEGMEFDGWFDQYGNRFSNGTTPVSVKFTEEGYPLSDEVIELQARYTVKYCTVRLMMQDGSSDIRLQVAYGEKLPDLSDYLKDDGTREIIGFGVSPTASQPYEEGIYTDMDLYALWREYKYVSFVYSATETKIVKVYREGNICVLPDGVWPGYVFEGWYSSSLLSGNKITTVPFNSVADTYYGKWSVGSYTIQFVADGVLVGSCTYSINDTDITIPTVPEKEHYIGRWEAFTLEFRDMIINAVYEPCTYQLTMLVEAGYRYQNVSYGEMYELPVPSKTGYNFIGWYYKDMLLTDASGKSLAPYTFDGDMVLTAGWEAKTCQLYFETNGGNQIDGVTLRYGEEYALTQKPERAGYYFSGWYDESMTQEYVGTIVITSDTVIYAKWIKSTPISSVEDLKKIADNPTGNYHLTADIDLKGGDWAPIENFTGILDGNGYKIHNFSLRQNGCNLAFVINNQGTIKNVVFSNVDVSSTLDGNMDVAIGVACANNNGRLVNVKVEKVTLLVNVTGKNTNQHIRIGCLAGENKGEVMLGSAQAELILKVDVRCGGWGDSHSAILCLGGAVGENIGTVSRVATKVFVDVNEYVYTDCYIGDCYEVCELNIGGVTGKEYGALTDCVTDFACQFSSNAGGDSQSIRNTRIGGVTGSCHENSAVTGSYSTGSVSIKRIGLHSGSFEMATGGIVGKVESGTVNNCASEMNIRVDNGHGGTTGGIVGLLAVNGKVTNVAYYGTIDGETATGGYLGGLAGKVEGWLTKGYFCGQIVSANAQIADIVGWIGTSGSVSKTIGNGNTGVVSAVSDGSSIYNYLIGTDYDESILVDGYLLFEDLGLFEADYWGIDANTGLYLITFPGKK